MPRPRGSVADRVRARLVDAVGDEALQLVTVFVEHAERGVARPGQLAGNLEHAAEDDLGVELGHQAAAGIDQLPQARLIEGPATHIPVPLPSPPPSFLARSCYRSPAILLSAPDWVEIRGKTPMARGFADG